VDDDNRVVIGMDPHKRSVTIEVMSGDEQVLGGGRFGTDVDGFTAMLTYAAAWPNRIWAIEGCEGIGRHVAQRLLAEGEPVVDVPAKLSARCGSSPPDRAARPTTPTPTRSPWSACA
jgi:transposase